MKAFVTAKIGVVLVISSVLAVWTLLAAQPAQAHEGTAAALRSPTCSNLPTAEGFYTNAERAAIASSALTPSATPKVGTGTAANGGYENLRYAKIIVPQIAAGELRVFDTRGSGVSDAILCRPGTDVTSRTSYSAHDAAERARAAANAASTAANESNANVSTARTALRSAASALDSAARSLTAVGKSAAATTASGAATTARNFANDTTNTAASAFAAPLSNAANALETARDAFHARFQIRTEVNPGDEEYVLVIATDDAITWALQFHGAIVTDTATAMQKQRQRTLNAVGDRHTYPITVTTPGLLTVETTGSTDTAGMLSAAVAAEDDSSGSGDNFKIVAPVTATTYTVTVDGQNSATGVYTLDMDFKVAMQTGVTVPTGVAMPPATWATGTGIAADDTTLQIQPSTDEDYFLLSIADNSSGFLTIEATDDTTSATDAATTGTLYGPTGELAMDTNSGSDSSHFRVRAPVEEGIAYLVKVTGTTGVYQLSVTLDQAEGDNLLAVPGAQKAPSPSDCSSPVAGEICRPASGQSSLERERYVFDVTESGALYVETTGSIDTVGTLYGPNGSQIATDDNSGAGNNFRISASVEAGLHLVEVRGQNRNTQGVFRLTVSFVPGAQPTDPTDPVDPPDPPPPTVTPDPTGSLDEPPPNSARSGIGTIRGWVCQDAGDGVEIRIMNSSGTRVATFTAPYGSSRGDVQNADPFPCEGRARADVGYAVQYNYNLLPAGTYTIEAYVGRQRVGLSDGGQTNTFRVVRISNEEYLPRAQSGRIRVEDFPRQGQTTILEWDQPSQNFQIVDFE